MRQSKPDVSRSLGTTSQDLLTGTPAPPRGTPIPQLTHRFVFPQLDGGTVSEQRGLTRPDVPHGQLPRFRGCCHATAVRSRPGNRINHCVFRELERVGPRGSRAHFLISAALTSACSSNHHGTFVVTFSDTLAPRKCTHARLLARHPSRHTHCFAARPGVSLSDRIAVSSAPVAQLDRASAF